MILNIGAESIKVAIATFIDWEIALSVNKLITAIASPVIEAVVFKIKAFLM
ncbi:MAG: hypothetical protein AAFR31_09985 [Cyanobacteria bacterium J06627_8]